MSGTRVFFVSYWYRLENICTARRRVGVALNNSGLSDATSLSSSMRKVGEVPRLCRCGRGRRGGSGRGGRRRRRCTRGRGGSGWRGGGLRGRGRCRWRGAGWSALPRARGSTGREQRRRTCEAEHSQAGAAGQLPRAPVCHCARPLSQLQSLGVRCIICHGRTSSLFSSRTCHSRSPRAAQRQTAECRCRDWRFEQPGPVSCWLASSRARATSWSTTSSTCSQAT